MRRWFARRAQLDSWRAQEERRGVSRRHAGLWHEREVERWRARTCGLGDTHASLWWNGVGHSYTITAAAGTDKRVLRVYVGGIEGGRGKLTAHLSDASAGLHLHDLERQPCARLGTRAGRLHGSLLPALSSRIAGPIAPGHLDAGRRAQSLSRSGASPGGYAGHGR